MPGEVLGHAFLTKGKISKDSRLRSVVQLALPASPSHSPLSLIYTPSKHHTSSMGPASARESVLANLHMSLYHLR